MDQFVNNSYDMNNESSFEWLILPIIVDTEWHFVSAMAIDTLSLCVAKSSAVILFLSLREEGFQLPKHIQCQKIVENTNVYS